jgi:hypothetical protein
MRTITGATRVAIRLSRRREPQGADTRASGKQDEENPQELRGSDSQNGRDV